MDTPVFLAGQPCPELGGLLPVASGSNVHVLRIGKGIRSSDVISHTVDDATHLCIVAEEGSSATVEITMRSTACAMEVIAKKNASLTILCVQESSGNIMQRSSIEEGASVRFQNVTVSDHAQHDLVSELIGKHATSDIDWIFYARKVDMHQLSARNVFMAGDGGGEITLKGVAEEQAHVRCDGLIDIGEGGGGTNTFLSEDVLMLDATAKVDAIPGLEIHTNDVRASHSATVSKVTPEDLFYFASRGIDRQAARHMYVLGFLADLTDCIADATARERVCSAVRAKYGQDGKDSKA